MQMNVTGRIIAALEKKSGVSKTGKEWASQDYVIQDTENDKILCFNVFGEERIQQYGLRVGINASVNCEVESREWNGKYYTSVRCTQCFTMGQQNQQAEQAQAPQPKVTNETPANNSGVNANDLPF